MTQVPGVAAPADVDGAGPLHAERLPDRRRPPALAIWLWSGDVITIGAIAVVTGLVMRIIGMSGWILWVVAGIFENIGVVQEGMETISRPNQVLDRPDSQPLVVREGEIRFDDVSFHYGRTAEAAAGRRGGIIHDLSLPIRPGEKVGLVGRSGAGKSTLVNLLLRFYDLESGRILIDGQDIAHVTQDSLRAQIGMVTQDTSLLHRSVRDNILYGRPMPARRRRWRLPRRPRPTSSSAGSRT